MNLFLILGEIIMRITYAFLPALLPLHHNDGVSCMSYLFLTTYKDIYLTASPSFSVSRSPPLSLSVQFLAGLQSIKHTDSGCSPVGSLVSWPARPGECWNRPSYWFPQGCQRIHYVVMLRSPLVLSTQCDVLYWINRQVILALSYDQSSHVVDQAVSLMSIKC